MGLMGPKGFRKATALGETPGLARRLQSTGKILRRKLSDVDRIIFNGEVLMKLRDGCDLKKWTKPDEISLRDLEDKELYYIES